MPTFRTRWAVAAAVPTAAALLFASPAYATNGDNGTVKIHNAETGEELRKNEPKVCEFYLDAFGFDAAQKVDWKIKSWAANGGEKGEVVLSGELTLDEAGHGRTDDMNLPDGQYKLFWNWEGEKGKAKHKVFKTRCEDDTPGDDETQTTEPSPSETPDETPSATPSETASETPSATPSESASPAASMPAEEGGSSDGNLAETGAGTPLLALSAVAAALVAGGGFLVLRRRKAAQG
ncbi:LPXTG cell wall anchor domain-containing protein [Streptomyces sp. MUM 178J]|uniref:LPXTG cell wall anchor domain-containing protein n=1 Tax=Streptomyces sp. MUM 178J TaxID=2791991 RepID=UPI001F03799A|nr:LPXTG cell wall anchor domain-containing protein [Streptomyces sp. MUM 178J]WRQ79807.1 LPXTG cell wall anchor domain-containing protein [Streptomyces sp. MUM 178J]